MTAVKRTALVKHSQEAMFQLVNDVDSYSSFLPWCQSSQVIEQCDTEVVGKLIINKAGITKGFTTRNTLHPFHKIELKLEDGPFKKLEGLWMFQDINGQGTKVILELEFEFEHNWLGKMLAKVFSSIADNLVQAFCDRADKLYG